MNSHDFQSGTTDANRFYSILLDARAGKNSSTMGDIAEKLVTGEKENSRLALEHLSGLKKTLSSESEGTVDLMIRFYREKIKVLQDKEEHIRTISRDSRSLIEEKKKKDEEIASVKQQISDCRRELKALSTELDKLLIKEQELSLIGQQLTKELSVNSNEIVNGLYEIILSHQENAGEHAVESAEQQSPETAEQQPPETAQPVPEASGTRNKTESLTDGSVVPGSRVIVTEEKPPFPRSVVRTTAGRVIAEYFYDPEIAKEQRHYIFHSRFFARVLQDNLRRLRGNFSDEVYFETLQMIQDAYKRISGNRHLHFEIATNEILNENTLKQLWLDAKMRLYDDLDRFASRLLAKIDGMGPNYRIVLREQMEQCLNEF